MVRVYVAKCPVCQEKCQNPDKAQVTYWANNHSCEEPKGMENMTREDGKRIIRDILKEAKNIQS